MSLFVRSTYGGSMSGDDRNSYEVLLNTADELIQNYVMKWEQFLSRIVHTKMEVAADNC